MDDAVGCSITKNSPISMEESPKEHPRTDSPKTSVTLASREDLVILLAEKQALLTPLLKVRQSAEGRGRPPLTDSLTKLAGIIHRCVTGISWGQLAKVGSYGAHGKYYVELHRLRSSEIWEGLAPLLLSILSKPFYFTEDQRKALLRGGKASRVLSCPPEDEREVTKGTAAIVGSLLVDEEVENTSMPGEAQIDHPSTLTIDDRLSELQGVTCGDTQKDPASHFHFIPMGIIKSEDNKQACPCCGKIQYVIWDGFAKERILVPNSNSIGVGAGVRLKIKPRRLRCKNPQCCSKEKKAHRKQGKTGTYEHRWNWQLPKEFIDPRHKYTCSAEMQMGTEATLNTSQRANSHIFNGIPTRTIRRKRTKLSRQITSLIQPQLFE